jgi:hypothetical protein
MNHRLNHFFRLCLAVIATVLNCGASARAGVLRVVTYNIDADTGGQSGQIGGPIAGPGLTTVLQGIGNKRLVGHAQPIDVLALEELNNTSTTTLNFIVGQLNAIYGAGTYGYDLTVDPTDGNTTGNGPSGLIYNTKTVIDLGATFIGTPSNSGAPRAPMRYTLQPIGGTTSSQFYLYVSHAKSGTGSANANRRNIEMTEIRDDSATLGPTAHVIFTGDFNINSSSEQSYQTLVSATLNGGIGAAVDPANPASNWIDTSAFATLVSESATSLNFRDDMQLVTNAVLSGNGFQLAGGNVTVFGNNGTMALGLSVNQASNTALADLPNASSVLSALTTATDHLPVVADYQFMAVPEPSALVLLLIGIACRPLTRLRSPAGRRSCHLPCGRCGRLRRSGE